MTEKQYAQLIANGLAVAIPDGKAIVIYQMHTGSGFGVVTHGVLMEHASLILGKALEGLKAQPTEKGALE